MKLKPPYGDADMTELKSKVIEWCGELGFQQAGITNIELGNAESRLADWLRDRFHGSMDYMERHGSKRSRPDELVPGTLRVISVRMSYLPESQDAAIKKLDDGSSAYISRYALGRDYHILASLTTEYSSTVRLYLRKHLQKKPVLAGLGNIPT